ncbi:MAG TPA: alpha-glucan family phosphorylase [Burkholderiales bacterium]|nr:alpha-glucan family phosphorylase [Burkholderiales bacterium]
MSLIEEFIREPRIAYFSMEIALQSDVPTYSGGLGVLAGDTMRSAADLELPMVGVTLVSRAGYFRQEIDASGHQIEKPDWWDPRNHATLLDAAVSIQIEQRTVWVAAWLYIQRGYTGARVPIVLLETDIPNNSEADRQIAHYLYGGDQAYRLKQEVVLGIGGLRMLQALGFTIRKYHMNEGHSALLAVELMRRFAYPPEDLRPNEPACDLPRVRERCLFTTHTPVEVAQDKFPYDLVLRILGEHLDLPAIQHLSGPDVMNMTQLALKLSEFVNGVAERHAEVSRKMFPEQPVHAITNGVHALTWTSREFADLYTRHLPRWRHEPQLLIRADLLPDEAVWQAHQARKLALVQLVKSVTGVALDPAVPIIGFARRMTAYKRPDLLFTDRNRLRSIARNQPFQIVLAGKAHPRDDAGKRLIADLHTHMRELSPTISMAYLPNYNMDIALAMVSGSDLWLNTPLIPLEASGTSGMKAAFNGVPSLSVLDGWWVEGCIEGVTGWAVGESSDQSSSQDHEVLYKKLERTVLPLFHDDRAGWIKVMKGAISKNASYFNSHRMMRRYVSEAYIR